MEGAVAINNEVGGEDDGGKETKNAASQVQEESTGAAGNFRRILLQSRRINLGSKRKMLDSFSEFRHVPGPVSGEVAAVAINGRQGEHREQSAHKRQHQDQKDDGKAASGAPAANMHFLNHADGRRQHHGKQRAHIDEHQHVTHAIGDPQSKDHAKKEQNVRPVVIRHTIIEPTWGKG